MKTIASQSNSKKWKTISLSTIFSGLGMWITGGVYHNLILPSVNDEIHPHHEGLGIVLIAYFILAFLMSYLYSQRISLGNSWQKGLFFGFTIGILWVFPHGLAMAGTHHTSILYEIKNSLYHIIEQGIGGLIISAIFQKLLPANTPWEQNK